KSDVRLLSGAVSFTRQVSDFQLGTDDSGQAMPTGQTNPTPPLESTPPDDSINFSHRTIRYSGLSDLELTLGGSNSVAVQGISASTTITVGDNTGKFTNSITVGGTSSDLLVHSSLDDILAPLTLKGLDGGKDTLVIDDHNNPYQSKISF